MTDRQHVEVPVTDVRKGDVIVTEVGVYYEAAGRQGSTVTFDGGFSIDYGTDATVTVLR